jgi:3'(2'), 5'-bisphosphate nucleotidase
MVRLDQNFLSQVTDIARRAGEAILEIYHQDFEVELKANGSPLTLADRAANEIIVSALQRLTPDLPLLSEESAAVDYDKRRHWQDFWLVDPLDGTREFINKNGEFTVNIALISNSVPVFGVVYAPVPDIMYSAAREIGAFRQTASGAPTGIHTRPYQGGAVTLVASRSHASNSLKACIDRIKKNEGDVTVKIMGSSFKLCLVAEGEADVYPRLGPTSEWDTAAAHAIVNCAGGKVVDLQGKELHYNKSSILNPEFIVQGDVNFSWTQYIDV